MTKHSRKLLRFAQVVQPSDKVTAAHPSCPESGGNAAKGRPGVMAGRGKGGYIISEMARA